mgnify:CR=1 FL=1
MKTLGKLNGWTDSGTYYSPRSAQGYLKPEAVNMANASVSVEHNLAVFDLTLDIQDILQLSRVLDRLENIQNILEAVRVNPKT